MSILRRAARGLLTALAVLLAFFVLAELACAGSLGHGAFPPISTMPMSRCCVHSSARLESLKEAAS